ncbi:MAG TPA: winged helix-turn-helix domain-containing protein [Microbacteriaceae bacterium]|nr:winged helix-turn-helix domain-containing protein [Microbacteriaceae bacterium]
MTTSHLATARTQHAASTALPSDSLTAPRGLSAVPQSTEARGFALYVGIDEATARAAGTSLHHIVEALRARAAELVPSLETHAAVALAPIGIGGRDLDVVRLALQDPKALAARRPEPVRTPHEEGVVIDLSRKRVQLDGHTANLTYKEFELLRFLVLREGRTVERAELIDGLWGGAEADEVPNARTIDVHVRRLRSKLSQYEDIVRTVRGQGYRFDRHADVSIRHTSTPSPDVF